MDEAVHVLRIQLHARALNRFQIITGTDEVSRRQHCEVLLADSRAKASLK